MAVYNAQDAPDNGMGATFYPDSAYASTFSDVTIYCLNQGKGVGRYACEVNWMMVTDEGVQMPRTAMMICTVNGETLSNIEVWPVQL